MLNIPILLNSGLYLWADMLLQNYNFTPWIATNRYFYRSIKHSQIAISEVFYDLGIICIAIKLYSVKGWLTAATAHDRYHHQRQHDLQKHLRDSHQHHEPGRRWLSIHKSCIIYSKTICRSEVIFSRPCKIFISAIIHEPGRRWLSHRNPRYADWQYINSHYWCKTVCRLDVIFRGTCKIPISTNT